MNQPSDTSSTAKNESHTIRCPHCGYRNPPNTELCVSCGKPLQPQAAPRQNAPQPAEKPPAAKPRKRSSSIPTPVIVALITTIGAVIVAVISSPLGLGLWGGNAKSIAMTVRVADSSGTSISNAKVSLFLPQGALANYTDSDGKVIFDNVDTSGQRIADVIVESDQYGTSNKEVSLLKDQTIEIRLSPKDPNNRTVFIRVIDDNTNAPIDGAGVELIVSGNNYTESTDSNGITSFKPSFTSNNTLDADISVNTLNYKINRQRVTLQPGTVQDVRLSADQAVVSPVHLFQPTTEPASSNSNGANSILFGQTISGKTTSPADKIAYSFTGSAGTVLVITLTSGDFCPNVRLYDPDAKLLADKVSECGAAEITETLPVGGVYTILVFDYYGNKAGNYNLNLQKIR